MRGIKRSIREAFDSASATFAAAGWTGGELRFDGKHPMFVISKPSGGQIRMPLAATPSHGPTGGAALARWTARRILRKHGVTL